MGGQLLLLITLERAVSLLESSVLETINLIKVNKIILGDPL
jgi:hypothetical protein